jgi:glycerol-3-phosphate dehydrogenase
MAHSPSAHTPQRSADVLVIGGGATGGGLAWDFALRGLRVLLVEMGDLATGTSGRYHGLLHSGGRYAVRDAESAKECIDENIILRRIAPESIEDTGGYFVLCPGDDPAYVDRWLAACAAVGIETAHVPLAAARLKEPALNPRLEAVYAVPDGTCDSWDLLHSLKRGAEATGRAAFLTYHRIEAFHRAADGRVIGARARSLKTGEPVDITCGMIVNAAGPWAAEVAGLAGVGFGMKLSRGAMLAYNIRWVNTVINKLRAPGDGDIFVPVGTVSVIGTTSVRTDDPGDTRVEPWETARILDEAEAMTPGISRARILRAWGGVRPLYDPGTGDGRGAKRTFVTLDHEADGAPGLISIVGGKLTTFRLMAERVADLVCAKLNQGGPCVTAHTLLPGSRHLHHLKDRLARLEAGETPGTLVCECEMVTEPQIREAIAAGDVFTLNDLRRDLRLGMGPCQGGFCAYRAAGICHEAQALTHAESSARLTEFVERRFGGVKPLLWGHNLRQALLAEHLYNRVLGVGEQGVRERGVGALPEQPVLAERPVVADAHIAAIATVGIAAPAPHPQPGEAAHTRQGAHGAEDSGLAGFAGAAALSANAARGSAVRVVVVGAGLAGLMAARAAQQMGAQVEVVTAGQGALTLHPGWLEIGSLTPPRPEHPYARIEADAALVRDALGILGRSAAHESTLAAAPAETAILATGALRRVDYAVGGALPAQLPAGARVLVVGISEWRDFYARMCRDGLRARGFQAEFGEVTLPHFGGNFDNWTVEIANDLDTPAGMHRLLAQLGEIAETYPAADVLALPAVLGFRPETRAQVAAFARARFGAALCEIPTLTPSVPGLRLYAALRDAIRAEGGRFTVGLRVRGLTAVGGRVTAVQVESAANGRPHPIMADAVILATGGLYGGGLESDYHGAVHEATADLTVFGVPALGDWFTAPLTAPLHTPDAVQPIHLAGVRIGRDLRPVGADGAPAFANVYAAGRLLEGCAPVAEGTTEGVDLLTGVAAAREAVRAHAGKRGGMAAR